MEKPRRRAKSKISPRSKKKTTRVTVDFPSTKHKRLKAIAALEGVSLQELIRSCVEEKMHKHPEEKHFDKSTFRALLKEISEENEDILRRLAGK